ncbi:MAG: hypothetical protein R3F50_08730 [Gammaproteobacteria bacterium]|jgi:hypothetical protein
MSKPAIRPPFGLLVRSATTIGVALTLTAAVPATAAPPSEKPHPHTRTYLQHLSPDERQSLRQILQENLRGASSRDNLDAIPPNQVYQAVFLDMLLNPGLGAGLLPADRQLIESLPAHNDKQFAAGTKGVVAAACRVIDRLSASDPAAAQLAARAYQRAQKALNARLDRHYGQVLRKLSESGRKLVAREVGRLMTDGSLVYAEMDLQALSFDQPDFVVAFLQDTCQNSEQMLDQSMAESRTLGNQLTDDFNQGAVQLFQPQ